VTERDPDADGAPRPPRRRQRERSTTEQALALLTRREHSRRELARKLAVRGHQPDEVDATVARLADAGWQDDARFACSLARSRAAAGYGPAYIRAELATHALPSQLVADALAAVEDDWESIACDLLCRRFGAVPPAGAAARRKAMDLLLRRGFDRVLAQRLSAFRFDEF